LANRKIDINKNHSIELPSVKTLIINLVIGTALAFLGPFGSYSLDIVSRLLYWIVSINIGYFIYHISHKLVSWYFVGKTIHFALQSIVLAFIASIPLTFLIIFTTYYFISPEVNLKNSYLFFFPQVMLLGLIIDALIHYIHMPNNLQSPTSEQNTLRSGHVFLQRLNSKIGTKLICFVMEDHYLHIYTQEGSQMILMRMKDALRELQEYDGQQVHRSWWVANDEISKAIKSGRKTVLIMSNGQDVPVSRNYLPTIKDLGW
jgi:hypothetical protein